jgi:UDP:flavonoid glycosyltransferase YjiC (YdhE family)
MRSTKVLFGILDWGLGHATRSVAIIEALRANGADIEVASRGTALSWLRQRYPEVAMCEKPGKSISYAERFNTVKIASQLPAFAASIKEEQTFVAALHQENHYDLIISDNCYGFFHPEVYSVFITHQLEVDLPLALRSVFKSTIKSWIRPFNTVWIPDTPEHIFSGKLSKVSSDMPVEYLGPISHLPIAIRSPYPLVGMVSGPEPHRALMERALIDLFLKDGRQAIVIAGDPRREETSQGNVTIKPNPTAGELSALLRGAETLVCRSGYSSLMDLAIIGKRAILVPTPGQPEQTYLANLWHETFGYAMMSQSELETAKSLPMVTGLAPTYKGNSLEVAVKRLIELRQAQLQSTSSVTVDKL